MARDLLQCGQFGTAAEMLRECLAIGEKVRPDSWVNFYVQSLLGRALLGQQKYAEAELLLLKGYQGMQQREKAIPAQGKKLLPEALERLIQLYEAIDKKEEAAKWRKQLTKDQTVENKP